MRTLLIDDLREIAVDRVARTFLDGIAALKEGSWDLVLLDHDLGDPNPRHTGYAFTRAPLYRGRKIDMILGSAFSPLQ